MYYIVTNELEDELVMEVVNILIEENHPIIPSVNVDDGYIFMAQGSLSKEHRGGADSDCMVIIGNVSFNEISGYKTAKAYFEDAVKNGYSLKIGKNTQVYLVTCSNSGENSCKFGFRNITEDFKKYLGIETLWVSVIPINISFEGHWVRV